MKGLESRVALLVDAPNMYGCCFSEISNTASKYGFLDIKEIFFNKHASSKLNEAAINNGYRPIVNSIEDIDCSLAIRASEIICSPRFNHIQRLALASNDGDFCPLAYLARDYRKEIIFISHVNDPTSQALMHVGDFHETVISKRFDYKKYHKT
ncbi:NYN domain-containing protein [Candidatus Woesearchaeota archaeon]|jgi:uncharacterized protein (TIGR00288 family)|nr:NYN domain-containing protein [Candidatus Woesearchaeota archaeon]